MAHELNMNYTSLKLKEREQTCFNVTNAGALNVGVIDGPVLIYLIVGTYVVSIAASEVLIVASTGFSLTYRLVRSN